MPESRYTSGEYLARNPSWHVEHSSWKADHVVQFFRRNQLVPSTVCEVGCGAGEILSQLQDRLPNPCELWGYEISPQAFDLCRTRENDKLHFRLADIQEESDASFDVILLLDVVEHLEDYFGFLRKIHTKSRFKVVHLPLELTLNAVLRGKFLTLRETVGHLHHFDKDIAVQALKDAGYDVLDYVYTDSALTLPVQGHQAEMKRRFLKTPRRMLFALSPDFAVRVLGGRSLLVLAQ